MKLTVEQLGGPHQVIVIGSQEDAAEVRARGIPVLGSVDGPVNASLTLDRRVRALVDRQAVNHNKPRIFAWGWHGATVASGLGSEYEPLAIVDDIDRSCSILGENIVVIPTSREGSRMLVAAGVPHASIAEPLIGVKPTSVLIDRETVQDYLHLEHAKYIVALVGKRSSWQEVIRMLARLRASAQHVDFVMPARYKYHSQLVAAARKQNLSDMLHDPPGQLRHVDVINGADAVWAPLVAPFDESSEVLDVVETAWAGLPLVASTSHPVGGVPDVGRQLATAQSEIEICGWILALAKDTTEANETAENLATQVKSIASPTSFIEGLQRRWSSAF